MDIGAFWALIWVISVVVIIFVSLYGKLDIDGSPAGISYLFALMAFVISTVACVWVASGIYLEVGF